MMLYEWRVSLLDGTQSVRLSPQGIWIGETVFPWSRLTDAGFVRYQTRQGANEEFTLFFGETERRKLRWTGPRKQRAAWRQMLVAFAEMAARQRPDLDVRDGPDAREQLAARWIGLAVAGVSLAIMGAVFLASTSFIGVLFAVWIGAVGSGVGVAINRYYSRTGPPPRLDWEGFAKREGREGELPAN
ncbi:hypothetical protein KUL25_02020 [Rhodobacteraceae bacterium N5(2021)]|uniref:Uncharacterized protein n=1 Tax=Gymnodinialimonas phycosphaerae TaxID=2841589 RepID=A0A975YGG3_9RHOB|nr:hypothetical protein [Gymnodinialimonas phycosphaerae]MBY4891538.1 hypothetical protein [Gymnodinialimonas phycosphaerae]